MRNVWIICRKELRSYFVSPIAYLLLAMFAIVFGFFFWNGVNAFVFVGMESQMRGEAFPMNINEFLIRPLISNVSVIGLFLIPMMTMWLFKYGNPDWKPLAIGYLGLLLQAGALLAIGTFISTLTRNQIIAGAATFGVCLLLWVLVWVSEYEFSTWARVLSYISVLTHFETFSKGLLYTKDVIFYITAIFLGLFLTARSLESLRWRS